MLEERVWKPTSCRMTCSAQRTRATRRMHVPRSLISRCGSRHDVDLPAQALLLTTRKLNTLGQTASTRRDIIVVSAAQVQCMAVLYASAVLCAVHALRPEECTWSRATVQQFTLCKMQDCCLKGTGWEKVAAAATQLGKWAAHLSSTP